MKPNQVASRLERAIEQRESIELGAAQEEPDSRENELSAVLAALPLASDDLRRQTAVELTGYADSALEEKNVTDLLRMLNLIRRVAPDDPRARKLGNLAAVLERTLDSIRTTLKEEFAGIAPGYVRDGEPDNLPDALANELALGGHYTSDVAPIYRELLANIRD